MNILVFLNNTKIKFTFLLIMFLTITSCELIVQEVEENNIHLIVEDLYDDELTKSIEITREEFVDIYARNSNITNEEASNLISEQTYSSLLELPKSEIIEDYSNNIKWMQSSWYFYLPENSDFKARLIVFYEVWESKSFKQINNAITSSEFVEGPYNAVWIQLNTDARSVNNNFTPGNFPTQRLSLMASGYFEATTECSQNTDFTIPVFNFTGDYEGSARFLSRPFLMQYQYSISGNY